MNIAGVLVHAKASTVSQVVVPAITTLGFPKAMAAFSWLRDVVDAEAEA